jgi:hypothetical protein
MAQPAATAKSLVSGCTAGMVPKPKTFRNHWKRRNKPNGLLKREIETAKRESFTYCLEDVTSHQAQSQKAQADGQNLKAQFAARSNRQGQKLYGSVEQRYLPNGKVRSEIER